MSDPQKLSQSKEYQERAALIDDPAMFLSLDSPHAFCEGPRNNERGNSSNSNNENEFQLGQVGQAENKQDDGELYEPLSANLQGDEEEKENQMDEQEEEQERIQKQKDIQKAVSQSEAKPRFAEDFIRAKAPAKKRKRSKKKDFDSQEDDYSGEYVSRKKGRPKQSKKGRTDKRNETTRSRGKPRGKGANPFKIQEIKREAAFLQDPISERGTERFKNTRRMTESMLAAAPAPLSFNSNWKIAEEFQQDWDSSNASMWEQSIHRRLECAILNDIMSLIQQKTENIVDEIARLPPIWYSTL